MGSYLVLIRRADGRIYYGIEDSVGSTVQSKIFEHIEDLYSDWWDDERQEAICCRCHDPIIEPVNIFTTYAGGSYWKGHYCLCGHLVSGIILDGENEIDGIPEWVPWKTRKEVFAHQRDGLTTAH